jgi:hypothetical protein
MTEITYPPTDTLKPVADDVFVVDSGPMQVGPLQIPIRMTVIRLGDALLLHSPTRYTPELAARLDELGRIAHLVAPNTAHWSFMKAWQEHYPAALAWAAPGLSRRRAVRRSGLRLDRTLEDGDAAEWGGAIETVVVRGRGLVEAALFHRPSRTLVLTDLVVNVEPEKLPPLEAVGARMVGATAPQGRAPIYARVAVLANGAESSPAAHRLVALDPVRVIFAHGRWFDSDGRSRLAQSLDWLLNWRPERK